MAKNGKGKRMHEQRKEGTGNLVAPAAARERNRGTRAGSKLGRASPHCPVNAPPSVRLFAEGMSLNK
jgi:hypothetical protein